MKENTKKRAMIYVGVWAVAIIAFLIMALVTTGYEDDKDFVFALMVFGVPGFMMLIDMLNFMRFKKYHSSVKFVLTNFLLVLLVAYVLECVVIIIGFGIEQPQYKLFYTFAVIGAAMAAILNLFQTAFYGLATGIKLR